MPQDSAAEISINGVVNKQTDSGAAPLVGASVLAVGPGGIYRSYMTDSSGKYVLDGLTSGEWRITAWHAEYTPARPESQDD